MKGKNFSFRISHRAIYKVLENGLLNKRLKLRIKRIKNRKCNAGDKRGKFPDMKSIHERPKAADNRSEAEHRKSDTVIGKHRAGRIRTHIKRKSGYLAAYKCPVKLPSTLTREPIEILRSCRWFLKRTIRSTEAEILFA